MEPLQIDWAYIYVCGSCILGAGLTIDVFFALYKWGKKKAKEIKTSK